MTTLTEVLDRSKAQPPGSCVVYLRDGRAIDITGLRCEALIGALAAITPADVVATIHKPSSTTPTTTITRES